MEKQIDIFLLNTLNYINMFSLRTGTRTEKVAIVYFLIRTINWSLSIM